MANDFSPVMIDWLHITFPDSYVEDLRDYLSVVYDFRFKSVQSSRNFFTCRYTDFDYTVSIGFGGEKQNHRAEVEFPGRSLHFMYSVDPNLSKLFDFFRKLPPDQIRCTRIDLCKDDFSGTVFEDWLQSDIKRKAQLLKSWNNRTREFVQKMDKNHDPLPGFTFYTGNSSSTCMTRLYDKKVERHSDEVDYWVRLELECRDSTTAHLSGKIFNSLCAAENFYQTLCCWYRDTALKYFRILEDNEKPVSDHNRGRIPVRPCYQTFLDEGCESSDEVQNTSFAKSLLEMDYTTKVKTTSSLCAMYILRTLVNMTQKERNFFIYQLCKDYYDYDVGLGVLYDCEISEDHSELYLHTTPVNIVLDDQLTALNQHRLQRPRNYQYKHVSPFDTRNSILEHRDWLFGSPWHFSEVSTL